MYCAVDVSLHKGSSVGEHGGGVPSEPLVEDPCKNLRHRTRSSWPRTCKDIPAQSLDVCVLRSFFTSTRFHLRSISLDKLELSAFDGTILSNTFSRLVYAICSHILGVVCQLIRDQEFETL
ncbi:hypothetical protein G7K_3500-t1 [Saitoella complicata NRRL Y-17804]|uniref:Uncharacterized protein n=1 Tax=Saitoella complicata (strain BCRC 22490 / CBS 7301 / JCM 7358 / NBRC 10748 / NRRL Y-17804) TaxID=698492 RepID=A0A0E9NHM8_SAICN|nr:hypothetical protein G7K_3500-t1 [Saitoella complicata NRRL Y-17804]